MTNDAYKGGLIRETAIKRVMILRRSASNVKQGDSIKWFLGKGRTESLNDF